MQGAAPVLKVDALTKKTKEKKEGGGEQGAGETEHYKKYIYNTKRILIFIFG